MTVDIKAASPLAHSRPLTQRDAIGKLWGFLAIVKATTNLETLLLVGAAVQIVFFLTLPLKFACGPTVLLLAYKVLHTAAVCLGWMRNPYLKGLDKRKLAVQIPNRNGVLPEVPSKEPLVLMLLGMQVSHPLGVFAPGCHDLVVRLDELVDEMIQDSDKGGANKYGFLGRSEWTAPMPNGGTDALNIFYFRSSAGIEALAHSPSHRAIWRWWDENTRADRFAHIGLYREVFQVEGGKIDSFYWSCYPTGMGALGFRRVADGEKGEEGWVTALCEPSKRMATFKDRMVGHL